MPDEGMFRLTVEFSTDNAAFEDDKDWEIYNTLKVVVDKLWTKPDVGTAGIVQDSNGNTIGRWYLGDDPQG